MQSYNSFWSEYQQRVKEGPYDEIYVGHIAYDATWALALALDEVTERIEGGDFGSCEGNRNVTSLADFEYTDNNNTISCLLFQALNETNFEGLTVSDNCTNNTNK